MHMGQWKASKKEINEEINQANANGECLELTWMLHMDGASNLLSCEASLILTTLKGVVVEYVLKFHFQSLK